MDVHPTKNVSIGIDPYPHGLLENTNVTEFGDFPFLKPTFRMWISDCHV